MRFVSLFSGIESCSEADVEDLKREMKRANDEREETAAAEIPPAVQAAMSEIGGLLQEAKAALGADPELRTALRSRVKSWLSPAAKSAAKQALGHDPDN